MNKNPLWIHVFTTAALLASAAVGSGQDNPAGQWAQMRNIVPRGYVCYRAEEPLVVDGRLAEKSWQDAPWTSPFIDIEGKSKPRPRFQTQAKMLWDEKYFYIAASLEEPHVWATLTDHDTVIFHDNDFEVFIDPNGDNHEYYELELNALNTTWDLFLPKPYSDGGRADNSWEIPGLRTAVHIDGSLNDPADTDQGWTVEIAIPWSVLSEFAHRASPPRHGDQWRVNFSRVEWRHQIENGKYIKVPNLREDNWVWSPQGIINMHRPERWGFVQFWSGEEKTDYRPHPSLAVRERLMEVYHRQKTYHKLHARWARSLEQLGLQDAGSPEMGLRETATGFQATIRLNGRRWNVRQDSKLWAE